MSDRVWIELYAQEWFRHVTFTRWLHRKRVTWERRDPIVSERRETTLALAGGDGCRSNLDELVWRWSPDTGIVEWIGFRAFDAPEGGNLLFSGDVSFGRMLPGATACMKSGDLVIRSQPGLINN